MSILIKSLKQNTLPTSEDDVYIVPENKAAIVKNIRLVNTGGSAVTVNMYVRRASAGTSYRIVPKDLVIPSNAAFIDSDELTLEGLTSTNGDRIRAIASASGVSVVISGVERDV